MTNKQKAEFFKKKKISEQKAQFLADQLDKSAGYLHAYSVFYQGALSGIETTEREYIPCKAINVDGDWYVIPNELHEQFCEDAEDEELIESGEFSNKYSEYATGGDLNLIQLYVKKP